MRSNERTCSLRDDFYSDEILEPRRQALPIGVRSCGQNTGWRRSRDSAMHLKKRSNPPRRRQALGAHVVYTISRDTVAYGGIRTGSLLPFCVHMHTAFHASRDKGPCAVFVSKTHPRCSTFRCYHQLFPSTAAPAASMENLRDAVARLEEMVA